MMIKYLLSKLEAETRKQVPVDVLRELKAATIDISNKLVSAPTSKILMRLRQLQEALAVIQVTPGTIYLTDKMKCILVEGYQGLQEDVQLATFEYYKTHDFDPNETIIELLRDVVRTAARKGVV